MIITMGHCFPHTDIDSLVGSIVLAEILKLEGQDAKAVRLNEEGLRESTIQIFSKTGLEIPPLVSKEELEGENVNLALVDHNNPIESYGKLGVEKDIYLCVDHHYIEDAFRFKTLVYRKVGATCTILAQMIQYRGLKIEPLLARALVYAIISDTLGLKSVKTSQDDRAMIDYLYQTFGIETPLETIIQDVSEHVDILRMDVSRILNNSLKEYLNGEVGIARIVVLSESYLERMLEILREGWKTKYKLFVFAIYKQHEGITEVYFFDKAYGCFESVMFCGQFISRSQHLLPYIMAKLEKKDEILVPVIPGRVAGFANK